MKKNKIMRAAALMLSLTLVSSCFVGGTFAKYVSEATGTDSARVAKWSFEVNDAEITTANTFTFDLFATATLKDTDGNTETDVAAADAATQKQLIAPGTQGQFDIVLENLSEVSAKYAIDYTVTEPENTDIPILFSVDNGSSWTADLADVAASDTDTKLAANNGTKTITVKWMWAYEQTNVAAGDAADTALGIKGTDTVTVSAKVTATQID